MNYVAICPGCNALCAALKADENHRVGDSKEIAKWIKAGMTIEQATDERIRAEFRGCTCKQSKKTQQSRLF